MSAARSLIPLTFAGICLGAWELLVTRLCSALFFWDLAYLALSICIAAIAVGALLANRVNGAARLGMPAVMRLSLAVPFAAAGAWLCLVRFNWAWGVGMFALPFAVFGAASALAFAAASDAKQQARLYFVEVAGALLGLVVVGPYLVAVAPVPVLGEVGVVTHLRQIVQREGVVSLQHHSTAAARTDLLQTKRESVRYVMTDGMFTARSVRWDGAAKTFDDPYVETLAAMKRLSHRGGPSLDVLLLGAGAGFDAAVALQEGAERVTAVEVNAATVAFARTLDGFAGGVAANPKVRTVVAEGRRYVASHAEQYDEINVALVQTSPASGRGRTHVHAHIVTVEAMALYLKRLKPGGALNVIQNTAALADATERTARLAVSRHRGAARVWRWGLKQPKLPDGTGNPFAHMITVFVEQSSTREAGMLRAASGLGVVAVETSTPKIDNAATDDRPFLFVTENKAPLHIPIAMGLALISFALLLRRVGKQGKQTRWPVVGFFAGAAAMGLQVLAVQCGQLALGDPVSAWSWSLAAVLGGSAVGAVLFGPTLIAQRRGGLLIAALACVGVLVVVGCRSLLLMDFDATGATLVWVAVGALPAGLPFLLAIRRGRDDGLREGHVIGADALGGVLGASLTLFVALHLGFSALSWLLCGLFALTAMTPSLAARRRSETNRCPQ